MSRFTILLGLFWLILAITMFITQFLIPASVEVNWATESEFDTVGFNVLRSESPSGQFAVINDAIIPGSADPVLGGFYQFVDTNVEPGQTYYYRLEDVEYDNTVSTHEIIEVHVDNRPWWAVALTLVSALAGVAIIGHSILRQRGNS